MERVIATCKRHGKIGKAHPHSTEQIGEFVGLGYRFLMGTSDVAHMRHGIKSNMDKRREHAERATKTRRLPIANHPLPAITESMPGDASNATRHVLVCSDNAASEKNMTLNAEGLPG